VKPPIVHPEAEEELLGAVAYYEAQRTGVGLDFQVEVENAVKEIQQHPQSFPGYKETAFRKCVLRRFPFSIFYQEREDCIWIAAIAHQKRKPGYWITRFPE
jgi:toxin ParE1/3/4